MPPPYVPTPEIEPGEWLRAVRAYRGFSLAELARRLDVPAEVVERWERNGRIPRRRRLRRILNGYARGAEVWPLAVRQRGNGQRRRAREDRA